MKKKICMLLVAFVAIGNVLLNMYSGSEVVELTSLKAEALANNGENSGVLGPHYKSGCLIIEKVIVGHDEYQNPIFTEQAFSGERGDCENFRDNCSPYPCTKYFQ